MSVRFVLIPLLLLLAIPDAAAAQDAGQPPPAAPRVVAGQGGFALESPNGDSRLQIGLLVHADGRFALDDTNGQVVDTFAIRRLRPYLRGRLNQRFEFYLNPDFAGSSLAVQDAYLDTIFSPAFRVRVGKAKTPFGFERLQSGSNLLFLERALPTALVPNRDVGVQVLGDLSGGLVSYLAGVTNGVTDGGSADTDTNDGKDVSGRLVLRPFSKLPAGNLGRGLGLGISGSRGRAGALPSFRTSTLLQTFASYAGGATPAVANGIRTRYSPQIWYFNGPFGGWAEYVHTNTPVARGENAADVSHKAWQVAASWVLTGENATDAGAGIRPQNPFNFGQGGLGALQLAARYHTLEISDNAVALELLAAGASRKAEGWTLGLRWVATANLSYQLNFERTVFDGDADGPRRAENGVAFRTQLAF